MPKEIRTIIWVYIDAFHAVELQIDKCLDQYFAIEHRATRILDQFCHHYDCPLHRFDLKVRVEDVVQESGRLIELMLQQQTVLPVQRNMLTFLMSELNVDSFNLFLLPPLPYDSSPTFTDASDYDPYENNDSYNQITDLL